MLPSKAVIKNTNHGSPYNSLLSHACDHRLYDPSLLLHVELVRLHENCRMASTNSFIEPPPQASPGDYSFSSTLQYGSQTNFSWTDDYTILLRLNLVQETAFVDDNRLQPNIEPLTSTVPLLLLPVDRKGGS